MAGGGKVQGAVCPSLLRPAASCPSPSAQDVAVAPTSKGPFGEENKVDFDRALKALLCVSKGRGSFSVPSCWGLDRGVVIPTGSTGHGQGRGAVLPAPPVLPSPAPCTPTVPETGCQVCSPCPCVS